MASNNRQHAAAVSGGVDASTEHRHDVATHRSTLEPADYRVANAALQTDRGHQAPLASFTGTDHWQDVLSS